MIYQFDLEADDIGGSIITVAEWDGHFNPSPTFFMISALAPNEKIYIASFGSTLNLHVIHEPNCPGQACQVEQHGIELPAFNFITIPNFPHYRNESESICDTTTVNTHIIRNESMAIQLYPNPVEDQLFIEFKNNTIKNAHLSLFNAMGQEVLKRSLNSDVQQIDLSLLSTGIYFYKISNNEEIFFTGKIVKK